MAFGTYHNRTRMVRYIAKNVAELDEMTLQYLAEQIMLIAVDYKTQRNSFINQIVEVEGNATS